MNIGIYSFNKKYYICAIKILTIKIMFAANKSSQVLAWLGFGFSLVLFLLVWAVNILFICHVGRANMHFTSMYMLLLFFGSILGILSLIFSIVGLVNANKHALKKYPGILGIVFCFVSLLSFFAPLFISVILGAKERSKIIDPVIQENYSKINISNEVILLVQKYGDVKCRKGDSDQQTDMSALTELGFEKEMRVWLETNGFDENVSIEIKYDKDTDYKYIVNVVEALQHLRIKNYYIKLE